MTVQNDQLLETTNKLRGVLKIAGQSSQNIVEVEKKLFSAIDDLAQLNQSMKRNNLEQRRRQLRFVEIPHPCMHVLVVSPSAVAMNGHSCTGASTSAARLTPCLNRIGISS